MSAPLLKIGGTLSVVLWWTFAKLSYKLSWHLTWTAGVYLWPPELALPSQTLAVSRAAHASCYWPAACCAASCWLGGVLGGSSSRVGALESLRRKIFPDRTIHVQIVRSGDFDTYKLAVTPVSECCGGCGQRVPVRGASCTRATSSLMPTSRKISRSYRFDPTYTSERPPTYPPARVVTIR